MEEISWKEITETEFIGLAGGDDSGGWAPGMLREKEQKSL